MSRMPSIDLRLFWDDPAGADARAADPGRSPPPASLDAPPARDRAVEEPVTVLTDAAFRPLDSN